MTASSVDEQKYREMQRKLLAVGARLNLTTCAR